MIYTTFLAVKHFASASIIFWWYCVSIMPQKTEHDITAARTLASSEWIHCSRLFQMTTNKVNTTALLLSCILHDCKTSKKVFHELRENRKATTAGSVMDVMLSLGHKGITTLLLHFSRCLAMVSAPDQTKPSFEFCCQSSQPGSHSCTIRLGGYQLFLFETAQLSNILIDQSPDSVCYPLVVDV